MNNHTSKTFFASANAAMRSGDYELALSLYEKTVSDLPELGSVIQKNIDLIYQKTKNQRPSRSLLDIDIGVPSGQRGTAISESHQVEDYIGDDLSQIELVDSRIQCAEPDVESIALITQMARLIEESGVFDPDWYRAEYPDVAISGTEPALHYVKFGRHMGHQPTREFDPVSYLAANPDVASAGVDPFVHYIRCGRREGRKLHPLPQSKPRQLLSEPAAQDQVRTIKSSPFFVPNWYRTQYGACVGSKEPAEHYLREGASLGFDPGPNFSTSAYLDTYRDIKAAGVNPLVHFIRRGHGEGRLPKPTPRRRELGLRRFSPEETGKPHRILEFDAPARPIPGIDAERITVHVHLYFTDMADVIVERLRNIRHPFTLLVSVQDGVDPGYWRAYLRGKLPLALAVDVRTVPNRGRDVAPWIVTFADAVRDSTIFCHLHTKKSHHTSAHRGWFRYLSHTLLGSPGVVDGILELICSDAQTGIVAPCYYWTLASQPNYGKNRALLERLHARLVPSGLPEACPDYPAGSFFWARTHVLRPLLDLRLGLEDFDAETGQVDGTLAHGIERLLGLLPELNDTALRLVTVDVAYDLVHYIAADRHRIPVGFVPRSACPHRVRQDPDRPPERLAVYTALTGGYETTAEIIAHPGDADAVFFSDDPSAAAPPGFILRVPNYIAPEPVRTARFVKLHPHVWFQHHDWAIWCDANIHFHGDLEAYVDIVRQAGVECGFIRHPVRDTVLEEVNELIEKRIVKDRLAAEQQIDRYRKEIPGILSSPLIETNFIVCRPQAPAVIRFMRIWWGELNQASHRDQLSVNYAIEKSGVTWTELLPPGQSARNAADFIHFAHDAAHRQEIITMTKAGYHVA